MPHAKISTFRAPRAWALGLLGAAALSTLPAQAQAPAAAAPASAASQPAGPTVRPVFSVPLQAAQALLKDGKAQEAMAKLDEAAAVPDRTPFENYVLARVRASAAQSLGNKVLVVESLETAFATGMVDKSEEARLIEAVISLAWDLKDHARVVRWHERYVKAGGPNGSLQLLSIQSQAYAGDVAGAAKALRERLDPAKEPTPPETHLRLLLNYEQQVKDPGAAQTMERLAMAYPRPEYWNSVIFAAARSPSLDDRALLEMYRLLRLTGNLKLQDLVEEMADLSMRVGLPGEAKAVLDEAQAGGVLSKSTPALQKLRERVDKQAASDRTERRAAEAAAPRAPDGNALANLGWAALAELLPTPAADAAERTIGLLEQGIAKGGLRRANEVRLHLGIAQLAAGRRDAARQTLAALAEATKADPLAPAIQLWSRFVSAPPLMPPR